MTACELRHIRLPSLLGQLLPIRMLSRVLTIDQALSYEKSKYTINCVISAKNGFGKIVPPGQKQFECRTAGRRKTLASNVLCI